MVETVCRVDILWRRRNDANGNPVKTRQHFGRLETECGRVASLRRWQSHARDDATARVGAGTGGGTVLNKEVTIRRLQALRRRRRHLVLVLGRLGIVSGHLLLVPAVAAATGDSPE